MTWNAAPPRTSPPPVERCPKCGRTDHVEEEEQSGSSGRWFVCAQCGVRFTVPPRR